MAKYIERLQARELRKEGKSIKDIALKLHVSKSTVSWWCNDILLSHSQTSFLEEKSFIHGTKGRQIGALVNKNKKREAIQSAYMHEKERLGTIDQRDLFVIGIALYWAEGSKSDRSGFNFVNSDPKMILLMNRWLQICMQIENKDLVVRVCINEIHRPRINTVLQFWATLLDLPMTQFRATSFVQVTPKKVYENYDTYYGVLSMRVCKSSHLKYRVLGLMRALKQQDIDVGIV